MMFVVSKVKNRDMALIRQYLENKNIPYSAVVLEYSYEFVMAKATKKTIYKKLSLHFTKKTISLMLNIVCSILLGDKPYDSSVRYIDAIKSVM